MNSTLIDTLHQANLLIDRHGVVKVSDFGETRTKSKKVESVRESAGGTFRYMAPEVVSSCKILHSF